MKIRDIRAHEGGGRRGVWKESAASEESFSRGGRQANDLDGTWCTPCHRFRDTANEKAIEPGAAVRTEDDQVRPPFAC